MKLTNRIIKIVARINYYQTKIKETEKELSDLVNNRV